MASLAGLLLGAVLGIHELQYLLTFGDQTSSALEHTGHDYLAMAVPFCGLVLAVGLSWCLLQAATGPIQDADCGRMGRRRFWLLASGALLVIFAGQELIEGWISPGHPGGPAVIFGGGSWTVLPLALGLGGLVTLIAGVAERAERTVCRARWSQEPRPNWWHPGQPPCVLVERVLRVKQDLPIPTCLFGLAVSVVLFYYVANAFGRLTGTVLSGALYPWHGLQACLWASAASVLAAGLLSLMLPTHQPACRNAINPLAAAPTGHATTR